MKNIVSAFFTSNIDSVGYSFRINRLKLIANNYNLILLTNVEEYVKKLIPRARVINIGKMHYNGVLYPVNLKQIKDVLKNTPHDLLYFFHNDALLAFFDKGPKLCEVCQSHEFIGFNCARNLFSWTKHKIKMMFNSFIIINGSKQADYIFAVSTQLENYFLKKGIRSDKIRYLAQGVDPKIFNYNVEISYKLKHIADGAFVIVYTGSVTERRGLDIMLKGMLEIVNLNPIAHLIIVGCNSNKIKQIQEFCTTHNIVSNITLLGILDQNEIPSIIKRANICLSFLENNETYSMSPPQKIFEYFAMGKPVIANRISTHTDYIQDGYNGSLIRDLESKEFVEKILQLIQHKDKYTRMCQKALECSQKYDINHISQILCDKINEICSKQD